MSDNASNEAPKIVVDRQLLSDLIVDTKRDGSMEAFMYFFQIFDLLSEAAETGIMPVIEDRALRNDFRAFWRVAEQGFASWILGRLYKRYGGFKSAEIKRIAKEKDIPNKEAEKTVIPFAEWWAKQPDYTDVLGKNEEWYYEAKAIHDSTNLNSLEQTSTGSSNRIESKKIQDIESTMMYDREHGGGVDTEGDRGNPVRGEPFVTIRNELEQIRAAIGSCISNSSTAALGAIIKRYGLKAECADSFLHTIEPNSDPVEQMVQFIVKNGGRLPPGS